MLPLKKQLAAMNVRAYSFGNAIDLEEMLKSLPSDRLIIGNIDPVGVLRNGSPEKIKEETRELLRDAAIIRILYCRAAAIFRL